MPPSAGAALAQRPYPQRAPRSSPAPLRRPPGRGRAAAGGDTARPARPRSPARDAPHRRRPMGSAAALRQGHVEPALPNGGPGRGGRSRLRAPNKRRGRWQRLGRRGAEKRAVSLRGGGPAPLLSPPGAGVHAPIRPGPARRERGPSSDLACPGVEARRRRAGRASRPPPAPSGTSPHAIAPDTALSPPGLKSVQGWRLHQLPGWPVPSWGETLLLMEGWSLHLSCCNLRP